jgi:glycosyltransferase involved in cell wall biosynthesis
MQNPDWRLVISGMQNAANTPKLKGQAKDLPIDFTGWLSPQENANWNAKAKIVVSIPSSDALSVSLMEAIYSNCICFVSDLPPNREVITDGVNGFVGCDFERYTEIDANILQQENAKLSQNWTYDFNKKSFLSLYE